MIKLNGHAVDTSFIQNFKKVYDLIEYDGPILSHFIDNDKRDYFYYWVDFDDVCNRWLVWKVKKIEIAQYVTGGISLKDLLLAQSKDFIYIADIDSNLTYLSIKAIQIEDLPNKYIPENESYYQFDEEETNPYTPLIDAKKRELHEEGMRKNSRHLKIVSRNDIHGSTIGLNEVNSLVTALTKSYGNFTQIDFNNSFENTTSDVSKLKAIYNAFQDAIGLRTTSLAVASFEIGLALDKTMIGSITDNVSMQTWAKSVFDKYQHDVIDIDYGKDEEVNRIIAKYTEDERIKIFEPLIKLSNNKKVFFCVRDKAEAKLYKVVSIEEKRALKIIPKNVKESTDSEYELISAIAVVKKGEKKITLTDSNTLFTMHQDEYSFSITTEDFKKEGLNTIIEGEIKVEASVRDNQITLSAAINDIILTSSCDDNKYAKTELLKKISIELTK